MRHFVNRDILLMPHYSLIYSFLVYGVHVWGLSFPSFLSALYVIQKKKQLDSFFVKPTVDPTRSFNLTSDQYDY